MIATRAGFRGSEDRRATRLGVLAACAAVVLIGAVLPVRGAGASATAFSISVDAAMWRRWGFEYPATYVFDIAGLSPGAAVRRREPGAATWQTLPARHATNFFNGLACVRFDAPRHRALVSAGFGATNVFELEFAGVASARFAGVARYYDDRAAAYTLSIDNWGRQATAHPGAPWHGADCDASDNYQAALTVCREFHLPVTIAINSRMAGSNAMWAAMRRELERGDFSWEPAVHAQTHPGNAAGYEVRGRRDEILGCRDDLLARLGPALRGPRILTHILTSGYCDPAILDTDAGAFLFVRGYNGRDNPESTGWAAWDEARGCFGPGGLATKDYDRVFARRRPCGRFNAADVAELDAAVDRVFAAGGICHAMWHPDRYLNNVIHDPRPGVDGLEGSTLVQHLRHVANRTDIWYVEGGWLHAYRWVADHVAVTVAAP